MTSSRSIGRATLTGLFAIASLTTAAAPLAAQGVTTGAVAGTVTDRNDRPVEGAQIQVQNRATGYSSGALTRANGYFFVPGLEVGGPYTVRVRRLGYEAAERNDVFIRLTQTTRVDVQLQQTAVQLAGVEVRATAEAADFSPSRQGVGTTVVDTLIRRMPSLQRDFTDLVRLTPQVIPSSSTTGAGPSAAGGYNRLNNFTVDGANQNDRFSLGSSGGRPGGATAGRIMSLEAVKEVQVALSPTDVRYGNFAGMIVNAVTRNGTNDWTGSAVYTFRTPQMAADVDQIRTSGFKVRNFGFSLGGPIIRDKLHFFIAPEWQERTDPAIGPALDPGATSLGTTNLRISADSIAEIINILSPRFDPGTAAPFSRGNPLKNLMGRIDWSINNANRLAFRVLDNTAEQDELARSTSSLASNATQQSTGIRLTSNAFTRENRNRSFSTQLFTNLASGISNELLVGYNTVRDLRIVPVTAPEISVGVTPTGGGTLVAVTAGTERFSPGNDLKQEILEVSNNLTIPFGSAHTFTVGARYEHTYIYNYFLSGAGYGAYRFPTIAALRAGTPNAYAFSYANGGPIEAEFNGQQISGFVQDLWNVTPNFAVTAGVRVDIPTFLDTPQQNPLITAAAPEIRTDWKPKTTALWSPRVGFNWDVTGTQSTQLRGNAGIYTGSVPYILVGNAYGNTGLGGVTVGCTGTAVPAFTTDVAALPRSCAGQPAPTPGAAGTVGINVTDPNFKYPQNFTTSVGVDHRLPWNVVGTFEAIYRKEINGLYVRDLNLRGPRMVNGQLYRDPEGRVLYADTFTVAANGGVTVDNRNQRRILTIGSPSVNFTEGAIMLTNAKAGHNYSLTGQLRKRFHRAFEATGAYTYMQSRDVQSLTSDRAISNWRFGRQYSGLENDPNDAQVSNFQRPHRFIGYGTWTAPWTRWQTDVTFYYELMSGHAITYVTNNDINGDNVGGNDPIYIPRDATDPTEIRIGTGTGANFRLDAQQAAVFERFIELHPCLDKQRGQIMERNSCHAPFTRRMDVTLRQTLPEVQGQRLTLQLDVFNFANLLNRRWGQDRFPVGGTFNNLTALQTASREAGALSTAKWNYNMNTALFNNVRNFDSPWSLNPNSASNNYQLQLTARYSF
jgi:outer membrane receptor protein involved in Fe transport